MSTRVSVVLVFLVLEGVGKSKTSLAEVRLSLSFDFVEDSGPEQVLRPVPMSLRFFDDLEGVLRAAAISSVVFESGGGRAGRDLAGLTLTSKRRAKEVKKKPATRR